MEEMKSRMQTAGLSVQLALAYLRTLCPQIKCVKI